MTGLQRTLDFLEGKPVDRPPCHPIIMRWAARYAGVNYRDFCLDYRKKCDAMIQCANDFDLDWVTVMSDAYCEASAFGLHIEYPEDDLPIDRGGHRGRGSSRARHGRVRAAARPSPGAVRQDRPGERDPGWYAGPNPEERTGLSSAG